VVFGSKDARLSWVGFPPHCRFPHVYVMLSPLSAHAMRCCIPIKAILAFSAATWQTTRSWECCLTKTENEARSHPCMALKIPTVWFGALQQNNHWPGAPQHVRNHIHVGSKVSLRLSVMALPILDPCHYPSMIAFVTCQSARMPNRWIRIVRSIALQSQYGLGNRR
jgi:hypothetical protein